MLKSIDDISSIAFNESDCSVSFKDLEYRLLLLEEQNRQLRGLGYYKSEVERLKLEVSCATMLKDKFRSLYNQTAVKLLTAPQDEPVTHSQETEIHALNQKVELLLTTNVDLKQAADQAKAELADARDKQQKLTEDRLAPLQAQLATLRAQKDSLCSKLQAARPQLTLAPGGSVAIHSLACKPPPGSPRKAKAAAEGPSRSAGRQGYRALLFSGSGKDRRASRANLARC